MRHGTWKNFAAKLALVGALAFFCASTPALAEDVTIGVLNTTSTAPVFLAVDRGYFKQEGLNPKIVTFDSAQPVALAAVSGDIDFGTTGVTSAFFTLAGQGALKIVSGAYSERKGFHYNAFVASKEAYAAGVTSLKALPGHSFALTQIGSPPHYVIGVVAEKLGLDLKSIRLLPLQSIPNQVSALTGNQVDVAMLQASIALPMIDRGDAKLLSWVSDEMSWQLGVIFASTKTANDKADLIHRTLKAIAHGRKDYVDAFIGTGGSVKMGPKSGETLDLLAKQLQQTPEQVKLGLLYMDLEGRLDEEDILRQIAWYKAQGMLKGDVDGKSIIDSRYVVPMPAQ
jgi:NitT/TauT family transport system substrate-binding protein